MSGVDRMGKGLSFMQYTVGTYSCLRQASLTAEVTCDSMASMQCGEAVVQARGVACHHRLGMLITGLPSLRIQLLISYAHSMLTY